ncbi:hypothetical protein SB659_09620 [Arthrobacter sp. SIMBA_036]|uniref:hypothetical protein n=1 Tax=Arthrobacter sp. SIMBA_036 TaxID=3085778 RepID=UPI00397920AD
MNPVQRGKLAIAAAAIGVGLLSVTGCGFTNAQQTSHQYSPSDGLRADLGQLQLRNMLIVAAGEHQPGRVIGAVFNQSTSDATLTISGADGGQAEIPVKAKSETYLNEDSTAVILSNAGSAPGGLAQVTIRSGSDTAKMNIPVVNGTLPEYKQYLPTSSASPSSTSSSSSASSSSTSPSSTSPSAGTTPSATAKP